MSKDATQEYKGNGKHEFENVVPYSETTNRNAIRLRVPGGWLYTVKADDDKDNGMMNTVFVPMPEVVKHKV